MADSALYDRLRSAGIVNPRTMVSEATAVGLRLGVAAAMLEKESRGGLNLFGHDRNRTTHKYIFPARDGDVKVTKALYHEYRAKRDVTGDCQGVGPCQLTSKFLQDAADKAGGCWKPAINMRIGFAHMASLMKQNGERTGARMYNGSGQQAEDYADDLLKKAARWDSVIGGAKVPAAPRVLRVGDHGPLVLKLTRRLSYVPSRTTKAPYLNGPRRKFDAATEAALKAFQREHGLDDDGRFGTLSARKLNRAVKREKLRRRQGGQVPVVTTPGTPVTKPVTQPVQQGSRLPALVARARHLDEEADDAWKSLVAYARRQRRLRDKLASKTDYQKAVVEALGHMTEILLRIEDKVEDIAEVEEHSEQVAEAIAKDTAELAKQTATVAEKVATGGGGGGGAGEPPLPVVQAEKLTPPPPEGPAPPSPAANGAAAPPHRRLSDLSDDELVHRVARLDAQMEHAREELIRRYTRVDKELARLRPRKKKGGGGKATTKPPHDKVTVPVQGGTGQVVVTKLGDRGVFVRRSKVALAHYLKAKGNPEHAKLRRQLRRDARAPGKANLATVVWQQGVKAAQHISGRPVSGELDGELVRILQPFWPRDNAGKRVVRGTPGWRAIPGQLTPNFNIKEFACKDAAHTGYIEGLVREKNLTKKQARERAKGLAKRLERLRKLGGNRPVIITSAYRTEAYNGSLKGAVPNSAHTRGFAVDTPAPQGVTLLQHEQHVLSAFECGVGYYPPGMGNFIHGDFDPTLNHGQRRRWGPGRG